MQYRLRRHDEQYRWVVDIGVPRFNQDGSFAGYIGSCIDITERKLAEESMASIGRRLIEAHEEERTRIGRELHDDINQRLALLAVELDRWRETLPSSPQLGDHVRQAQQRIHEIGKDVQSLSHRLHSSKLDYLGLVRAANSFCRELSEQSDVNIKFSHADVPRTIPKEVSLCLFRVLQEALQNAVKHSGVREFTVDLRGTKEAVELTVIDTGSGFDEQEAFTRQGLGLISMRERLQLVQGEFSVASGRGVGTTIRARVPRNRDELQAMAG
jgi:signal transduction histidine kinase